MPTHPEGSWAGSRPRAGVLPSSEAAWRWWSRVCRTSKSLAQLGIVEITVKAHLGQPTRKMEADSRADVGLMVVPEPPTDPHRR
jgi:hypothetical protein